MLSKKQKRAFHRVKSGVRVAQILKQPVKHLVLTTSPQGSSHNIANDFQVLRKRIHRKFGVLLPYFMVRTNEGNGVLHVLYRTKQYLPQRWLSYHWNDIHLSSYVYVKEPPKDVARYVVTQYVADQGTSYQRCSWSQSWVCKGFVKQWKAIIRSTSDWKNQYFYEYPRKYGYKNGEGEWVAPPRMDLALSKWDEWLMSLCFKQMVLF